MTISVLNGARERLATKPSVLPAIADILPILRPICMADISVSGEDSSPRTTSSSFITLAGLKKCVPATSRGRLVIAASSSMSSAEVLENSSAPGFITSSSLAKIGFLTSISSNTASMTTSQSLMSS